MRGVADHREGRMSSPETIVALFHRTRQGLLAARVANTAYLAIPGADGKLRVAYGSGIAGACETWTPGDFYGVSRIVYGEDGFRAYVEGQAEHGRELARLDRREVRDCAQTPWGRAQFTWTYADGIARHSTAGHGGFYLDPLRNADVHAAWRHPDGWYEEDSQWAKVAATFPSLFTDYERRSADETLRNSEPDGYELITGVVLLLGQSHVKDERRFKTEHAADWIVISAIRSAHRPGLVECVATIGGGRQGGGERCFLVAAEEYEIGRFGFVIDLVRHAAYNRPG
jgi:hypothetical protein